MVRGAGAGAAQRAGDGMVAIPAAARVDSVFARFAAPGSPGCVVSAMRAGDVVFSRAYGLANVETGARLDTGFVFAAGSITKQFTAFAVALLVAEGRLELDADVHRYLPELPRYPHRVTLRHLLHHVGGVREYSELPSLAGDGRPGVELAERVNGLSFVPGTQYLYSNTGFLLLGRVVERVTGEPLGRFMAERIFRPLGMTHTLLPADSSQAGSRGVAYALREGRWVPMLPPVESQGDAGLLTTPADLARWDRNFYDARVGGRRVRAILHDTLRMAGGALSTYSFGLHREPYRGLAREYHGGLEYGFRTSWWRFPRQRLSVLTTCNTRTAEPDGLTERVAELFLAPTLAAAGHAPAPEPRVDSAAVAPFLGFYVSRATHQYHNVAWRDGRLAVRMVVTYYELSPLGGGRFAVRGEPITLAFRPRPDGGMEMEERSEAAGRAVVYERPGPNAPRPALADFAGDYASPELGARWAIRPGGSGLVAAMPRDTAELRPAAPDVFSDGYLLVVFRRDAAGRVTGFAASTPRIFGVEFVRRSAVTSTP
ncbi:serine hydrolase domain-containing protein [Longimicrobium sp.]|uniref:serine hydrolase domain-containing protein n=1 Tax=Longimicrobium sp. TaxID=2029185 RepID=UPI002C1F23F4|nr:serine hydrolase domain-containing protein [Longimicrobium sp.]HSU17979.1 serine hydrolase domain-containing protein [Longimicrobium sp.]